MEAVRPKKPKTRVDNPRPNVQPSSPAVVNGLVLPDVPSHSVRQLERSVSPEPEEM